MEASFGWIHSSGLEHQVSTDALELYCSWMITADIEDVYLSDNQWDIAETVSKIWTEHCDLHEMNILEILKNEAGVDSNDFHN